MIIRKYPITKNIIKILFFVIFKFFLLKRVSLLTYDTADDIITSLEIIEKLLFPETDFWRNNYLKYISLDLRIFFLNVLLLEVLSKTLKSTTFRKTRLNINDRIKHDGRNSRFNRLYQGRRVRLPRQGNVRGSALVPPFAA